MSDNIVDLAAVRLLRKDPAFLFSIDVYEDRLVEITARNPDDQRVDHERLRAWADALDGAARLFRSAADDLEAGK